MVATTTDTQVPHTPGGAAGGGAAATTVAAHACCEVGLAGVGGGRRRRGLSWRKSGGRGLGHRRWVHCGLPPPGATTHKRRWRRRVLEEFKSGAMGGDGTRRHNRRPWPTGADDGPG